MVRTKADGGGRKAVAAKAPRKQVGGGSSDSAGSMMSPGKNSGGCNGGNPIRWWPTPDWQKGVGDFFPKVDNSKKSSQTSENSSSESSTSNTSSDTDQPGVSNKELGLEKH
ncbi:PCNA-associated factor-like [Actinia tenebrosa]|uniref:PCNA-associated factor n=1 Tax=Actinia tenebrosa TaxID=6105 RepID=A0A6P8HR92_ACTTE|nr:PCNA-associated factor-like [Actinia tenebrosa]